LSSRNSIDAKYARHATENDEGIASGYVEEFLKEHNEADAGICAVAADRL
jgi:hypothetical protein